MSGPGALFERSGSQLLPTDHARGPWRPDALHGGAVAALLASAIQVPGWNPARVTFELLAPVPAKPLTLEVSPPEGGRRVVRQSVTLLEGGTPVAEARCVAVREAVLDLPAGLAGAAGPFAGLPEPDLSRPRPGVREAIGWDSFDSGAVSVRSLRSADLGANTVGMWINLLVSVVEGEPTPPLSRIAAAADYGSAATGAMLPFDRWSYMNTELTLHLPRELSGSWVGLISTGTVGPNGRGLGAGDLYDRSGPLGRSAQTQVVEERERVVRE
ncbi:thioesterase family protein [Actinocorallia longicatena]|uniref:Thioesterase superfamily protein n=1 Tax=Actinocorallia longicatena TaxID=111803 RepID=A0ABP6Q7L6_9ACTN